MLRSVLLVALLVVSLPAVATTGASAPTQPVDASNATDVDATDTADGASKSPDTADGASKSPDTADGASKSPDTADGASKSPDAADGASGSGAESATASAAEPIVRTIELSLTPEEPGSVRAVVEYEVPSTVTQLSVSLGEHSAVVSADGFERTEDGSYEWTASTATPTLELRVDANRTSGGRRASSGPVGPDAVGAGGAVDASSGDAAGAESGLVFADAGAWALVQVPQVGTRWRWEGAEDVGIEKAATVNGPGATGGEMAYLGPVARYEASARGETVELVVPERATLNATPERVLGSLVAGSERLRVGARSDRVFVVAAPDDVDWGIAGLQYGEDDAWVLADAPVDSPDSVWLHEYVHTRQSFEATASGRWLLEASADYYAALLAYEQGNVTFDAFRDQLARGQRDRYGDDVLAFPQTWSGGANYLKGALATGAIDLALRRETGARASFQTAFRALNAHDGPVSNGVILDAIEDASGPNVRQYAGGLTQSDRTAQTWGESTHERQFALLPPLFDVAVEPGGVTATGAYGERTLGLTQATVVTGETLVVDVAVTNVGWRLGEYRTGMRVEETVVAERGGELAADAATTASFEETFEEPGTYRVRVGGRTLRVDVVAPPSPTVEDVEVPSTVAAGEAVRLTFAVRNDAPVPGRLVVPVSLDGEVLANETVLVPARSSVQRTYTVSFSGVGEHEVRVRDTTVAVQVAGDTAAPTATDGTPTEDSLPASGFGPGPALAALAALLALVATRHGRGRP